MAKESMKAREVKRAKLVAKYAEKKKQLKAEGNYEALQLLPKNASRVRLHNRCKITGRPKGYIRDIPYTVQRNNFGWTYTKQKKSKLVIIFSVKYCPENPDQFKQIFI